MRECDSNELGSIARTVVVRGNAAAISDDELEFCYLNLFSAVEGAAQAVAVQRTLRIESIAPNSSRQFLERSPMEAAY